ncbi:protein translocase subunit SecD [Desertivibrio insolitus]|uniref:protein translocase subunit SecD n=1 Tax=Herbiconiux sp. SYSU D00978 TaxID=2812562 RepID=UPI001A968A61|nr:protein translocase subunit SecD [Herbiconiux sp. SYSU D00978]
MARRPSPVRKAWRSFIWLGVILAALAGLNAGSVVTGSGSWTPRLALDLEGGTQIILAPQLADGQAVSNEQLEQAVSIIRQRVDATGVSESEINTQGQNVVVSIPGVPDDETLARIQSSAKLEFRPVLQADVPTAAPSASPSAAPTEELSDEPATEPANPGDLAWVTPAVQDTFTDFDCTTVDESGANVAPADEPLVTCQDDGSVKYILGPTWVAGERIVTASAGTITTAQGASTGQWAVNLEFDGQGTQEVDEMTSYLFGQTGVQNQFAIVLDGEVISAPTTNAVITNGQPQISGSFTQETAQTLADQLRFGALPIGFEVQSSDTISATLGESQLASGLLAGLIGLILVVVYSLFQYRLLGLVTVASLLMSAAVTYLFVTYLSSTEGYRLSLAGVAGLIVAIGITADSFIVYFERIRDELRDGRGLESAVEAGWKRAFRTILVSDAVNFLAAAVLFVLAVGNVRGFALTLGITTIMDLIVVTLFTHPVMRLLARTKFFGEGHKLSGLDPKALGAVYRGRAQFRTAETISATKRAQAGREAQRRQTIAERKAAEAAAAAKGTTATAVLDDTSAPDADKGAETPPAATSVPRPDKNRKKGNR